MQQISMLLPTECRLNMDRVMRHTSYIALLFLGLLISQAFGQS